MLALSLTPPPITEFIALRADEGWGRLTHDTAKAALAASTLTVSAYEGDRLAGFGRVVGDGVLYFYIQDMIVARMFRGRGIGQAIMAQLLQEIRKRAPIGATIGLMAAEGKEGFYAPFGFRARPAQGYGAGMTQFVLDSPPPVTC